MLHDETIVARATPPGTGGIAIIRLSGPEAVAIAERLFTPRGPGSELKSHEVVYGILHTTEYNIKDNSKESYEVDRCLMLPLLGARSYTGEDTVEFHCHGGPAVVRAALAACCDAGARTAAPGEFTRRAFLHGKLSLDQAEAVADLIGARNPATVRAALRQLTGGLDRRLRDLEAPLRELATHLEATFEFLDEEEVEVPTADIVRVLEDAVARCDELLAMAPAGRMLRDGVQVVLAGAPNVGKSSLFNALLDDARAIVDDEPGTTRDIIIGETERDGVRYVLHDTAGLREAGGRVEAKGMDLTRREAADADIVLLLGDGAAPLVTPTTGASVVRVATKADRGEPTGQWDVVTSSRDGRGLDLMWETLENLVRERGLVDAVAQGVVLNERHRDRLTQGRADLLELHTVVTSAKAGPEVVATMLTAVLARLGEVSGRVFTEQLLGDVFDRFCVGK